MVDIKKDDDLARPSPTLADPRSPSPTLAYARPSFYLATLSTLATLAYTLHLADSAKHIVVEAKVKHDAQFYGIKGGVGVPPSPITNNF